MHNMSLALHCNFLGYLLQNKDNAELMNVLDKYRNKGNGNGGTWQIQYLLMAGKRLFTILMTLIFHQMAETAILMLAGERNWLFQKKLKSMPLEQALKDAAASRFVRQATCMEHPEQLVQIGKDVFKQEAYLWVPNGDASKCNETRAAWLGCDGDSFSLNAYYYLYGSHAARGVRRS